MASIIFLLFILSIFSSLVQLVLLFIVPNRLFFYYLRWYFLTISWFMIILLHDSGFNSDWQDFIYLTPIALFIASYLISNRHYRTLILVAIIGYIALFDHITAFYLPLLCARLLHEIFDLVRPPLLPPPPPAQHPFRNKVQTIFFAFYAIFFTAFCNMLHFHGTNQAWVVLLVACIIGVALYFVTWRVTKNLPADARGITSLWHLFFWWYSKLYIILLFVYLVTPFYVIARAEYLAKNNAYCIQTPRQFGWQDVTSKLDFSLLTMTSPFQKHGFVTRHAELQLTQDGTMHPYHWSYFKTDFQSGGIILNYQQERPLCTPSLHFAKNLPFF